MRALQEAIFGQERTLGRFSYTPLFIIIICCDLAHEVSTGINNTLL